MLCLGVILLLRPACSATGEDFLVNVNLNLASKPFNNRVLPWILTGVILFISFVGLILVVQLTTTTNRKAALAEVDLNKLKQNEQVLMAKADEVKDSLTPQQQQALQAAHKLVDRKAFSWSRLLADLESSLPDNVRVSRIAVRGVATQGNQTIADLDLAVFSKSSKPVVDMIESMDREGIFHANIVTQNLQKGRGESGTEYELTVVYRPRVGVASESLAALQEQETKGVK
jgi:Tfp pilus assembly protein PilN